MYLIFSSSAVDALSKNYAYSTSVLSVIS